MDQQQERPKEPIYVKDSLRVDKFRKQMGLSPVKTGVRTCLCCDKEFFSEDLKNMKTCVSCRRGD
jgi:hypothetical protein